MKRTLSLLIAVSVMASPLAAHAARGKRSAPPPTKSDAVDDELMAEAMLQYDLGNYPLAIEKFQATYRLSRRPILLFNIAQAYRLDGHCKKAIETYRHFVRRAPEHEARPVAERHWAELSESCVSAPSEASEEVTPSVPPAVSVAPEQTSVSPASPTVAAPLSTNSTGPTSTGTYVAYAAMGVGTLALGFGGYYAWRAQALSHEVSSAATFDNGKWQDGQDAAKMTGPLFITGGVLVAAGLAWLLWPSADDAGAGQTVGFVPMPGGFGVSYGGGW